MTQSTKRWPRWVGGLVVLVGCGLCVGACTLLRHSELAAGIGLVVLAIVLAFLPTRDGDA
jgi:hypothetical protein